MPLSKKIKYINIVGLSSILVYGLLLFINFDNLPDKVPVHINFKGQIDDYGSKYSLIMFLVLNIIIFAGILLVIKNSHIANYPVKITEENKSVLYYRMQFFLSLLSVLTSLVFSFFVFKSFDMVTEYFYFMIITIILPLTIILIFVRK